jgi:hypothetical protein
MIASGPSRVSGNNEIPNGEFAEFLTAEGMVEQGGQDGPISNAFQRLLGRGDEQLAGLMLGKCRRFPLVCFGAGAFYTFDRIMGNGVLVAEVLKQR